MKQNMRPDISELKNYIRQLEADPGRADLNADELGEDLKPLGEAMGRVGGYISEICHVLESVSRGELDNLPENQNPYGGFLKQHIANLRHLTWQAKCIAEGDYEQHVDFLGEFADSFNVMIEQLKYRKHLVVENERMQKAIYDQRQQAVNDALENQVAHFERLEAAQKELRAFRHDVKNHFLTINSLMNSGDYGGAKDYIASIYDTALEPPRLVTSGNFVLDALISEKGESAKRKGIAFDVEMKMTQRLKMENADVCILFANALDNAIEACELSRAKQKRIKIQLTKRGNILNGVMKNTSDHPPRQKAEDGTYETGKEDTELHGIGMRNMEEVAEKYHGFVKSTWEDGEFLLTVFLMGV